MAEEEAAVEEEVAEAAEAWVSEEASASEWVLDWEAAWESGSELASAWASGSAVRNRRQLDIASTPSERMPGQSPQYTNARAAKPNGVARMEQPGNS